MFTYDIQQTEALDRAFASAAVRLGRELKELNTQDLSWFKREHYFAYRSKEVLKYVIKNRRQLYKMFKRRDGSGGQHLEVCADRPASARARGFGSDFAAGVQHAAAAFLG